MIILTGAAGFIGSAFLATLNQKGLRDIFLVDDLESSPKWKNLQGKDFSEYIHKQDFLGLLEKNKLPKKIEAIIHLGACSSTTEQNVEFLISNNCRYSITLAEFAAKEKIRFIYASSAATYGNGEHGYSDHTNPLELRPLNPYGFSKNLFDQYMLRQNFLPLAVGLKFFNVFGPNEYHKEHMRSVVVKAFHQIKSEGKVKLFKSQRPDYADGDQKRDFIYVKDCCAAMWWLMENPKVTGLFNLGSGQARTWNALVQAVFAALKLKPLIEYIDMPEDLRAQYQYFTQAEMQKLRDAGFQTPFHSLEEGIRDYVLNYLEKSEATL